MPRKGPAPRRQLMPDPVHHSVLVTQLVNKVLQRGKRSLAEGVVYDALQRNPLAGATVTLLAAGSGIALPPTCFDDQVQQGQVTLGAGWYIGGGYFPVIGVNYVWLTRDFQTFSDGPKTQFRLSYNF